MNERLDRIGAVASTLCAVHCAVCALLPAALGVLGLSVLLGHEAEWVFTLVAVAFAGGALALGFRRHRSPHVAGVLALGIVGLLASRAIEMSGEHGDHPGDHHAEAAHHDEAEEHHAELAEHDEVESEEHDDVGHQLGTAIGVLSGLLLVWGHFLNIRTTRRCSDQCCP